ncbi:MAG: insulinase family protein [Rhodospirillales bacterium]|nr:insulinase family protein [Rhodospirillales bacterium]
MARIRVTTLANGLRVVTDPMDQVETASVGVWIGIGSRHEDPAHNGVAHIVEHMAFKGTKRRTAQAIAEEMDAVGGYLNAYTTHETTAFYAKVLKDDVGLAIDIVADILQNATLDREEFERERTVILQEIVHSEETPDDVIFDRFQETAFPGQGLGRPVFGTAARVKAIARQTVIDYMREHYSAPRMILTGAGRIDHDTLVALANQAFTGLPGATNPVFEPARYQGGDFREVRDLEQAHVVLGFEGVAYTDPDFYPMSVLSTLLGGGMSSRLFQEVREKRGLAYTIYSFASSYTDGGLVGFYAATAGDDVAKALPVICDEIAATASKIGEQELARARAQLKSSLLMSMESTSSRAEQVARQIMVFGRPIPVAEIIAQVEAVDRTAVERAASRMLRSRPTLTALGAIKWIGTMDKIEARLGFRPTVTAV